MTTLIFPNIAPMRQTWRLLTDSTVSPRNPYTGTTGQRFSTPGARWGCTLTFSPLHDAVRGARQARSQLKAFLVACRGQLNDFWLHDRGNDLVGNVARGTFPRENVVANGYFDTSISGWNTEASARWAHGWLMLRSTGAGQARFWQECTVRDGAHYHVRVHGWTQARSNPEATLRVGTTAHDNDLLADVVLPNWDKGDHFDLAGSFVASGTTAFVEVEQVTNTPNVCLYTAVELQRVPQIHDSPVSTANVLTVNEWDAPGTASQDNLIVVADMAEVAGQLMRATSSVCTDGSGRGFVQVEAPLRSSPPAVDTDVILYRPRGRFMLATSAVEWEDAINRSSEFAIDCEEVIL